jgi:cyclophilin family peptidyl-prolyl cis-trans isomerase
MRHTKNLLLGMSLVALVGAGCAKNQSPAPAANDPFPPAAKQQPKKGMTLDPNIKLKFPGVLPMQELEGKKVHLKTDKGEIVFELLPQEGPKAASNFVYLTKLNYYNGLTFHRVEPGFVIQGGDPSGNGTGGPGYEFQDDAVKLDYKEGIVAMANKGPNTNGSQFFIMLGDVPLPPSYSIFGRVTKGMDVVKQIQVGDKMTEVTVENN